METKIAYDIKETTWPEKTFITKQATVAFDELPNFFGNTYGAIYGLVQKLGIQACDPPCAVYYTIDEVKKETRLAAAVPVKGPLPEINDFEVLVLPASKVITTTHYGSYESMGPVYQAMEQYLNEHHLERELIIEEYFSDPAIEKDPGKWKTNIHFVLKQG